MGKACAFAILGLVVTLMVVVPMASALDHVVGGSDGWTSGVDYDGWMAGKSFTVGDTLLFSYDESHTVDVVTKDGYDNCDVRESIVSFLDGNTSIPLNRTGPIYIICATIGHCLGGMKLSLIVQPSPESETSSPPLPSPLTPSPSPAAFTPFPADELVPPGPPLLAPNTNGGSHHKLSNVLGFVFAAMFIII